MKILIDFLPIVLFFGTYKFAGIMAATAVAMGASVSLAAWGWWRTGRPKPVHLFSAGLILVFGGATLVLADEQFIKLKPTILYGVMALVFLASGLTRRTAAERMLATVVEGVPQRALRRINLGWVVFFGLLAGVNWLVANRYDTETWVNFKLFGLLGLTLVFVVLQAVYLARIAEPEAPDRPHGKEMP